MTDWKHDRSFIIVYQNPDGNYVTNAVPYDEKYVLTSLTWKGREQKLKNLFTVDYKGKVTKFQDLQLQNKALINKIKGLTEK